MKLTEHLDRIYRLVLDRADPAKVRVHIEIIRDQVEAAEKIEAELRKQIAREKKLHAKEKAAINQEFAAYKDIVETFNATPKQILIAVKAELQKRLTKSQ